MAKKTNVTAVYVRVEPRGRTTAHRANAERFWRDVQHTAQSMMFDIKRHVEDVGHVSVETDTEDVCEHCGYAWTETSSTYNGGCCESDEANAPQAV